MRFIATIHAVQYLAVGVTLEFMRKPTKTCNVVQILVILTPTAIIHMETQSPIRVSLVLLRLG
jgi:hypothetical protein